MILKLKRTPGIYLVGFMACGKTTVGRMLAEELGWHFNDLDHEIESDHRTKISDIFDTLGEESFRDMESEVIEKRVRLVERGRPTVLALGGGAFIRDKNFKMLNDHGVTVWIDCSFDIICQRVSQASHRPLARDPKRMRELYDERRDAYARAEFHLVTHGDSSEVVRKILALPIF